MRSKKASNRDLLGPWRCSWSGILGEKTVFCDRSIRPETRSQLYERLVVPDFAIKTLRGRLRRLFADLHRKRAQIGLPGAFLHGADVIVPPGRALRVKGVMTLDFEVYRARPRVSEAYLVSPEAFCETL